MMGNSNKRVSSILAMMGGAAKAGMAARSLLPQDYATPRLPQLTVSQLLKVMMQLKEQGLISDLSFDGNSEWNTGMGDHGLGHKYNRERHYEKTRPNGGCKRGPMTVSCFLFSVSCPERFTCLERRCLRVF